MLIVDCHMHIGDLSAALADGASHAITMSVEEERAQRVVRLADSGADWAIIQPAHSYLRPDGIKDTMRVNDGMAEYRAGDPKHFPVALGTVEPLHGERSLEEIDRCKHELGLDGLSWHPRLQGVFLDNPWDAALSEADVRAGPGPPSCTATPSRKWKPRGGSRNSPSSSPS